MTTDGEFRENSQAVTAHLNIIQAVIQRMAANSAGSKAWCITLVSAILVIVADNGKPQYVLIAIVPTILFLFLDTYYLALEKGFRDAYNDFISKLHSQQINSTDLFAVEPKGALWRLLLSSLISFSIWPFYVMLFVMIYIVKGIVLK
ncbi:MAG: hypothetical protein ABSA18_10640 [Dehalococcoidia bacterium]|jgi:hypothetical protein